MIQAEIWHYDGHSAVRRHANLMGMRDQFHLIGEGWESGPWRWADLVALDHAGGALFGHKREQGWRIGFTGAMPDAIAGLLPGKQRYGGMIDRIGLWAASAVFACIAAMALFIGIKAPGWVAPFVPQSWEDSLGDAMVGDFGGRYCHTPDGDAALRALARKMDPQGHARSIEVANIRMVNAIALPGRRIILFTDLVEKAESPDELAGVLGHEIGHVERRDTLTALMRQLGLSVILGGLDGSGGAQLNALMGLSFSRDAEHEADLASIRSLKAANISPGPTAGFFIRLGAGANKKKKPPDEGEKASSEEDGVRQAADWLASHPAPESRRALFAGAVVKGHRYEAVLTPEQWDALRNMCVDDRDVKSDWDFGF